MRPALRSTRSDCRRSSTSSPNPILDRGAWCCSHASWSRWRRERHTLVRRCRLLLTSLEPADVLRNLAPVLEPAVMFWQVVLAVHILSVVVSFGLVFAWPLLALLQKRLDPRAVPTLHR